MRKPLVLIITLIFSVVASHGQTASGRIPKARVVNEEKEDKPGFFKRLFGGKKETPEPTPEPKPKATPKPRSKSRSTPPPETEPEKPAEKPKPREKAKPPETKPDGKPGSDSKPPEPYAGMSDSEKYKAVRQLALEDEKIKALSAKAVSAIEPADASAATAEYNRALFQKIRKIEPSLDGYVDRVEAAMTKRLTAEKNRKK